MEIFIFGTEWQRKLMGCYVDNRECSATISNQQVEVVGIGL